VVGYLKYYTFTAEYTMDFFKNPSIVDCVMAKICVGVFLMIHSIYKIKYLLK